MEVGQAPEDVAALPRTAPHLAFAIVPFLHALAVDGPRAGVIADAISATRSETRVAPAELRGIQLRVADGHLEHVPAVSAETAFWLP